MYNIYDYSMILSFVNTFSLETGPKGTGFFLPRVWGRDDHFPVASFPHQEKKAPLS